MSTKWRKSTEKTHYHKHTKQGHTERRDTSKNEQTREETNKLHYAKQIGHIIHNYYYLYSKSVGDI